MIGYRRRQPDQVRRGSVVENGEAVDSIGRRSEYGTMPRLRNCLQ